MDDKKLPVYKLMVNECNSDFCDQTETNYISIVETPAIETNFIAFGVETNIKPYTFKVQDTSKRMLIGPLMIADLPIYRVNPDTGEEYYVLFDSEAIENSQKNFTKKNYNGNINMQHETIVDNAYLLESWIITDPKNDKSAAYGFKGLTKGTWMGVLYCPNEQVWNDYIKTGKIKGFSVEGVYAQSSQPIEYFSKNEPQLTREEEEMIDMLTKILTKE